MKLISTIHGVKIWFSENKQEFSFRFKKNRHGMSKGEGCKDKDILNMAETTIRQEILLDILNKDEAKEDGKYIATSPMYYKSLVKEHGLSKVISISFLSALYGNKDKQFTTDDKRILIFKH